MVYNENDLFAIKGRIGELVYAIYVETRYDWSCYEEADLQKVGVDFIVTEKKMAKKVDVKLSDKLGDFFSMAYSKPTGLRYPFRDGGLANYLEVVSLDWTVYMKDHLEKAKTKYPTEELAKKELSKYIDKEELDKLVLALEKQEKRNTHTDLCELSVAHRTCERLEKEFKKKDVYKDFEELLSKYVRSIDEIQTQDIIRFKPFLGQLKSGHSITDGSNCKVMTKRDCYTRYGMMIAAEFYWKAIPSRSNIYTNPLEKTLALIVPTTPWPYKKTKSIIIDESGKALPEMNVSSLEWIRDQNQSSKSSFKKLFDLTQDQFDRLLFDLIEEKNKVKK